MFSQEQLVQIFDAISFSAEKHKTQRRKDLEKTPYVNHPLDVARTLMFLLADEDDADMLYVAVMGAILHDTLEDTETTYEELETRYGTEVTEAVKQVTNNKQLSGEESKAHELEVAKTLDLIPAMIRISDKISNVNDIDKDRPSVWDKERKLKYIKWAKALVNNIDGDNIYIPQLKFEFQKRYYEALSRLG